MQVSVVDNHSFSVNSQEIISPDLIKKTYNFYGWIESPKLRAPSPQFNWTVNVYDTCAAFYEMAWTPFSAM
jgi:hypothetical protein